jgi:hypothetical protein
MTEYFSHFSLIVFQELVDTQLALHAEEDRFVQRVTYLKGKKRKPEERIFVIGTFRIYVFKNGKVCDMNLTSLSCNNTYTYIFTTRTSLLLFFVYSVPPNLTCWIS